MEIRKFTKMVYWTIWTVFLLVKHGTLVSAMVTQTFSISENLPVDSIVGRLTGSPPYILYENPNEGAVQSDLIIDTNSGIIKVGAKLDREKLDKYTFGIYSNDGLNIRVTVKVTDVNDNSPTFKKASMTIQLSESAPEGLKIPLGTAVDKDLGVNSTQRYEIISKSSDDIPFSVVTRSGDNGYAELVVKKALDYETKKRYDLIIRAYDGGNPPRYGDLRVIVELSDSNDLYPVFTLSRYSARISENATVGTSIVQVLATDGDSGDNGKVRYSIDRGRSDPDNIFSISSDSGIIYLQKKLDFETKQTYELVVIARDNGSVPLQTTAIVSIQVENINEHPPVIDLVFLTGDGTPRVPENAQPGDYVARISVHDPDVPSYFANVNVTLEGGDGFFGLTTRDNVVYLMVISRPLTDDDTKPFYMLTVTATDAGIPSLTTRKTFDLRVATYNDPPKFSKKVYYANLKEDAPPGSSVYQLTAKDYDFGNNSVLSYSLSKISGSHYEWFHINAKTGLVTTAARVDCETAAQPHITVVATDAGKPPLSSNTTLVITIMDNNDNQPIFDHSFYNITIPESQPKGSCIIKVSASDPDCSVHAQLSYSIARNLGFLYPNEFTIRNDTGFVCLGKALDYETKKAYEFPIEAKDSGGLSTTTIMKISISDVNDNRPVFDPVIYNVNLQETTAVGHEIVMVTARDKDSKSFGNIAYNINSGNPGSLFSINTKSGVLTLKSSLPSTRHFYSLAVGAVDGGGLASLINANVSISIVRPGQQPPVFTKSLYKFTITEELNAPVTVGTVFANAQGGGSVSYSIVSGNPSGLFQINPSTGLISTSRTVDRETHPSFLLNIQAVAGNPPAFGNAQANITVKDTNDNSPEFPTSSVEIPVKENVSPNVVIYQAHAIDKDYGDNGQVRYQFIQNPSNKFIIDSTSGQIRCQGKLDFEKIKKYNLVVKAFDLGSPMRSSSLNVIFTVQDVNDNRPTFSKSDYSVNIRESTPMDQRFLRVNATDIDSKNNAKITYSLLKTLGSEKFNVFPDSGWLYVKESLRGSSQTRFELKVQAEDDGHPRLSDTTNVVVNVLDDNDHAPVFSKSLYNFAVTENQNSNTPVGQVAATDNDKGKNAEISYSFETNTHHFKIDSNTGRIFTTVSLDRENNPMYVLVVRALDNGSPPKTGTTQVQINVADINDNAPVFKQSGSYYARVLEGQPVGTQVIQVTATDRDADRNGKVSYAFGTGGTTGVTEKFTINPTSGWIVTRQKLKFADATVFDIPVIARDSGSPQKSTPTSVRVVVVSDSEGGPIFSTSSRTFVVTEGIPAGTVIGAVKAQDPILSDNNALLYYITDGNRLGTFGINATSGEIFALRKLDYEVTHSFSLTVMAKDTSVLYPGSSIIKVNITVLDINDNAPVFTSDPVILSLAENVPVGNQIWQFKASDKDTGLNGTIRYRISQQIPNSGYLRIDDVTGMLSTAIEIDYEKVHEIMIVVEATDQGPVTSRLTASLTTRILINDVNDNTPKFVPKPPINVFEDEPLGYPVVHVLATDADSKEKGKVTYAFVSGNEGEYFKLETGTGLVSLSKHLDYETRRNFALNITASDGGSPVRRSWQLIQITVVDINDHPPRFEKTTYTGKVPENSGPGAYVVQIRALDSDTGRNAELSYFIPNGIANNKFRIDAKTGTVTTSVKLDRESQSTYIITAYVKDNAFPTRYDTTTIYVQVVDVNDNAPAFEKKTFQVSVPENVAVPDIRTIAATDPDEGSNGQIRYSITGGNTGGKFQIDALSGRLSCSPLDREVVSSYDLQISAQDYGTPKLTSTCQVVVTVLDRNDNDPIFVSPSYSQTLQENVVVGTTVLTVLAKDQDAGENGAITYYLAAETGGMFDIDAKTGVLTTSATFDREKKDRYSFDVYATDGGQYDPRKAKVTVTIYIADINDNAPVFKKIPYTAQVNLNFPANARILQVEATDADAGDNAKITYSYVSPSNYFSLDSTSGEIKSKTLLTSSAQGYYRLEVDARDAGTPSKSSRGVVEIKVGNPGGSQIKFLKDVYNVSLYENSPVNTQVLKVRASFISGSGTISFSLIGGNDNSAFALDSTSGQIIVKDSSKIDYEKQHDIRLTVMGQGGGAFGYTTVYVNLKDKNDNPPRFSQKFYVTSVDEGLAPNSFVTKVTATDPDAGQNAEVVYQIVAGNSDNAFTISPAYSGIVKTNILLDREVHSNYVLEIEAVDQGQPNRLSSTCTLKVNIVDTNDNRPFFPAPKPVFIPENTKIGTQISVVTANDVDLNPKLTYSFASGGNPGSTFSIDRFSGQIFVAKPLDYESTKEYRLQIQASDTLHNTNAELVVKVLDVDDNPPVFTENIYDKSVSENLPAYTSIIKVVASDADTGDNGKVVYSFGTPPADGFTIDEDTGIIFCNKTLKYNPTMPIYQLVVMATDKGKTPLTAVAAVRIKVLDINDNPPVFTQKIYRAHVSEAADPGLSIVQISAKDSDSTPQAQRIEYYIQGGNDEKMFNIVTNTGDVVLIGKLDHERTAAYSLTVLAKDHGLPPLNTTAQVDIIVDDVNDWSPVFTKTKYEARIPESSPVGSRLVQVSAEDKDSGVNGQLRFSILAGNKDDVFYLDPQNGWLTLRKKVDHETLSKHRLIIQATDCLTCSFDQRLTAYSTVLVNVTDVNDNKPHFPVTMYYESVPENKPIGTTVFTAHAIDMDSGSFGSLTYVMIGGNNLFRIDPKTGVVTTSAMFDYESRNKYNFNLQATDQEGTVISIPVVVNVRSADEYQPTFEKKSYDFSVRGDATAGDIIGQVRASDADNGEDGRIKFTLREPTQFVKEHFAVNISSGVIFVIKDLNKNVATSRKRRSVSLHETGSGSLRRVKRATNSESESVPLAIEASSGKQGSLSDVATVMLQVDRGCTGCALPITNAPAKGMSTTAIILLVVFLIILAIVVVVVILLLWRRRQQKSPPRTSREHSVHDIDPVNYPIHMNGTFAVGREAPPRYADLQYDNEGLTENLSDKSNTASSGRGSADENDEDAEIRIINTDPLDHTDSHLHPGMPDSGIQHDEDTISEHSVRDHQEYLARLGIDVSKLRTAPEQQNIKQSVESVNQFSEEGGDEVEGLDLGTILNGPEGQGSKEQNMYNFDQVEPSHAGSLSSVINSEEEFSGSYNWDYLLDWGPSYSPLAHVFGEIAKLKDETIQPKKVPTQIISHNARQVYHSKVSPTTLKNMPPPIITNAPPVSFRPGSNRPNSNRPNSISSQNSIQSHISPNPSGPRTPNYSVHTMTPRSPISYDFSSQSYRPSFSPSLSPLALGSPQGMSSMNNGAPSNIPYSNPNRPQGVRVPQPRSRNTSVTRQDQELHI